MRLPLSTALFGMLTLAVAPMVSAGVLVSSGSFTVDRTAPEAPVLLSPANGASEGGAYLQLEAYAEDATSGVEAYQFEVNNGIEGWQPSPSHSIWDPATDTYDWRCRAVDRAGNESDWSIAFSVDFLANPDADVDSDGLADKWEGQYFGHLGHSDGSLDSDGDGMTDAEEFFAESHPFEFYLSLDIGWNLLSLPFDATDQGLDSLRESVVGGRFREWDGRRYSDIDLPSAYGGFWVYAHEAEDDVPVSGLPVGGSTLAVQQGWNVVGPRDVISVSQNDSVHRALLWNGRRFRAMKDDDLMQPFAAYYLSVREDTTLELGVDDE